VGNAIKFTFEGHVKIILKSVKINKKKLMEIVVEDTGIGIK